jgi:hypothetical protein
MQEVGRTMNAAQRTLRSARRNRYLRRTFQHAEATMKHTNNFIRITYSLYTCTSGSRDPVTCVLLPWYLANQHRIKVPGFDAPTYFRL